LARLLKIRGPAFPSQLNAGGAPDRFRRPFCPLCGNPEIRHCAYRSGDVLTALLAADREIAVLNVRKVEHECQHRRTKDETSM
jgi:hypothetical protein